MTKRILVALAATATIALGGLSVVTLSSTAASAGEYCRRDVTGQMLGSSFSSMEQCEATRYGLGGDCMRDPFSPDSRSAYAYQPGLSKRSARRRSVGER
jgi:hypothetical protein